MELIPKFLRPEKFLLGLGEIKQGLSRIHDSTTAAMRGDLSSAWDEHVAFMKEPFKDTQNYFNPKTPPAAPLAPPVTSRTIEVIEAARQKRRDMQKLQGFAATIFAGAPEEGKQLLGGGQ